MRSVDPHDLTPGTPLPAALYTRGGRLLAHGGTVLSGAMSELLTGPGAPVLRLDSGVEPPGIGRTAVDESPRADDPQVGAADGAQGAHGVIGRVGAGARVESVDAARWERRLVRTRTELRRAAPALVRVAQSAWERIPPTVEVGVDPVTIDRGGGAPAEPEGPRDVEQGLSARRAAGVAVVRAMMSRLLAGEEVGVETLEEAANDLVDAVSRRAAHYSIMAMGLPRPIDSLPDHAYSTGAIAVGIAAQLGWPRADVRMVGVAGMVCDSGLGLVQYPVRVAARALTDVEMNAVRRHTEYSVALCRSIRGLPERVILAAYQHHERCDGSGYPLGRRAEGLHDYSRVLAVAECFAAMTAPRAHRPAMSAHAAMSELARLAGAGAVDRVAVRGLVDALGLYPAGSFVRLNSGQVAMVGASGPPGASDRPVVHVVQPSARSAFGRAIDLTRVEVKTLRVVEAVRAPEGVGI